MRRTLQNNVRSETRKPERRRVSWLPMVVIAGTVLLYLAVAPVGGTVVRAPEFSFDDINPRSATFGQTLALGDLYSERGMVLNFIASWCEICRNELPDLQELHANSQAPIVFIAADEHGAPDSLLIVAERNELTAPILFVPQERVEEVERRFSYEILPATYLIDRGGAIRLAHEGALPVARLMSEMENALGL